MEDGGTVGDGCCLEEVGKTEARRGECLGCAVAAAPADEVVAFSAPEYPP